MLRHAQTVNDGRLICRSIHTGSFNQLIGIQMTDLSHLFGSIILHQLLQLFKVLGEILNIIMIDQVFFDHHMHHAVGKGYICTRTELQMNVRIFGEPYGTGIYYNESCTALNGLTDLHTHNGMRLFGV